MYNPLRAFVLQCAAEPFDEAAFSQRAASIVDWSRLALEAADERQSAAVYRRVADGKLVLPAEVLEPLRTNAVSRQRERRVQIEEMTLLAEQFDAAEIPFLVLKGAALAHLVYTDPLLRECRDLDLLVKAEDGVRASAVLAGMGYIVLPDDVPKHHLPPMVRTRRGSRLAVELHTSLGLHSLVTGQALGKQTFEELWPDRQRFTVGEAYFYTLGPSDMLRHVYRHGFAGKLDDDWFPGPSFVDIWAIVNKWHQAIDWDALRKLDAQVLRAIPAMDALMPFADGVAEELRWRRSPPGGLLRNYWGWPRKPLDDWGAFWATMTPARWMVRVRHGGGQSLAGFVGAWARHVAELYRYARIRKPRSDWAHSSSRAFSKESRSE